MGYICNVETLAHISVIASALIPITLGWKKRLSYLWIYTAGGFFFDVFIGYVLKPLNYNRHWAGNLFFLFELVVITLYFKEHVPVKFKKWVTAALIFMALFFCAYTVYNSIYILNGTAAGLLKIVYIIYGILGFYIIQTNSSVVRLEKSEYFWANVVFVIYFSASFMLFLFHDYLLANDKATLIFLWVRLYAIVLLLFRLLLIIPLTRKEP